MHFNIDKPFFYEKSRPTYLIKKGSHEKIRQKSS